MGKVRYGGKTYDMSMHDFLIHKKAKEMVDELMRKPELLDEFNKQMRKLKLKKINDELKNINN